MLFFLGTADTLVPITTVQLGEPVTLSCVLTEQFQVVTWVHWYKQSAGNTLKLIAMLRKSTKTAYGPGFSSTRFTITNNGTQSTLFILSVIEQDEGMYHCAQMDWTQSVWTGIYLSIKGNSQRTSSYTIVQEQTVSDPTRPTSPKTLQCLVLTCSGEPSVFWFRTRSDTSYPDIMYIDEKRNQNCEKPSDNQKKCGYNFSKKVSSSEADTYYCAVATCGEIIFGNGTKVAKSNQGIVHHYYLCYYRKKTLSANFKFVNFFPQSENRQDLDYAALHFSGGKEQNGKKKRQLKTEESIYSQVIFNSDS
uniref:Ig-like domain-containing protein n=1 Tax=Cyprinodon variegatus TaxID=28743 RepID=A0A3Q2FQP8_CYPVA